LLPTDDIVPFILPLRWTGIEAAYIEPALEAGGTFGQGALALYKALGVGK